MNFKITGDNAFYKQSDYEATTRKEFASNVCVGAPAYNYETTRRIWRIAKEVFSVLLVLPFIYNVIHGLIGKLVVIVSITDNDTNINLMVNPNSDIKYKRCTINVNGYMIDTIIRGRESTFANKQWMIATLGNGMQHRDGIGGLSTDIADTFNYNVIYFNPAGVGASTGWPNRTAMRDSYRAMLKFLENEMGAEKIIGYGLSLGGGTQGDALNGYKLNENIKYLFIKDRTFCDLGSAAADMVFAPARWVIKLFGWNMDSVESSMALKCPEIILQKANAYSCKEISSSTELAESDLIIPKEASLAKALLDNPNCPRNNKVFLGIPENHNGGLNSPTFNLLCNKIREKLVNV